MQEQEQKACFEAIAVASEEGGGKYLLECGIEGIYVLLRSTVSVETIRDSCGQNGNLIFNGWGI